MIPIQHYVALGDSMSDCDHYAAADAAERFGSVPSRPPFGSASLLWKNRDDPWPEFTGRDLSTFCPSATFHDLARDGTGLLPGVSDGLGRLPIEMLDRFNDLVRETADKTSGAVLADVHRHFMGHGVSAGTLDGYYWSGSIIEPGTLGASEIRRVWLDAIVEYALHLGRDV